MIPLRVCSVCDWRWYSVDEHPCPRCVNREIEEAAQIKKALVQGHVKTPRHKPGFDKRYLSAIRGLVVEAVFARWNQVKDSSSLAEINRRVQNKIRLLRNTGRWNEAWIVPSKRTVDRRVNEAADRRFYGANEPTKIIAVRAGHYCPNPCLFEDEIKKKLTTLLTGVINR